MNFHSRLIKGILTSLMVIMILGSCANFFPSERNFMAVPTAHADQEAFDTSVDKIGEVEALPQTTTSSQDVIKKAANLATLTHRLFLPLINFFAYKIGDFLGSDYVYSGPMGKMLQKIWVISRNLVNIAFVFLLLWMALKEIFFVNKPEIEIKTKIIPFALLLVAVNFSWLATKIVLDASNVATNVVFAIPSGISDPPAYGQCQINDDPTQPVTGACYPTAILAPTDAGTSVPLYWEDKEGDDDNCAKVKAAYQGNDDPDGSAYLKDGTINIFASDKNKKLQRRTSICVENLNLFAYNQNTAVIYLTYGMARIQNLVNSTGGSGDAVQLSVGLLLSLIIQIAYTVALFALFVVLVFRMAMLWLFVGFSPFMILIIWFRGAADYEAEGFKFGFNEFTKWAFAPAKVGVIFAVSFIMISAGQSMGSVDTTLFDNVLSQSGFVFKMLEPKSLFMGMGSLQTFIWLIMCLAVLWMGVFGVVSDLKIVSGITNRIKEFGVKAATMAAKAPYVLPVLPLGKGGAKASIKETLSPLAKPFKDFEAEYFGGGARTAADVRALNQNAGSNAAKARVSEAITRARGGDFYFDKNQANQFAKSFGLELKSFADQVPRDSAVNAIKKSGATDDTQAGKIYDAIKRASTKTPETVREEKRLRIEEQKRLASAGSAPAAQPAPNPAPGGAPTTGPKKP